MPVNFTQDKDQQKRQILITFKKLVKPSQRPNLTNYCSYYAQSACELVFRSTFACLDFSDSLGANEFVFIIADEDNQYFTIICAKARQGPIFMVVLVDKKHYNARSIQFFSHQEINPTTSIRVRYQDFTKTYFFKSRVQEQGSFWLFDRVEERGKEQI